MYKEMEWPRNVLGYGRGYFRHCATILGTEFFFEFLAHPRPPPDKFSAAYLPAVRWYSLLPRLPSAVAPL